MKFAVLKYDKDDYNKRVIDLFEDLYFSASNWKGYTKLNLPILVQRQWENQIEMNDHKEIMYLFTDHVYIGFKDSSTLSGPMIYQLNMHYLGYNFILMSYAGAHNSDIFSDHLQVLGNQRVKKDEMILAIDNPARWESTERSVIEMFEKMGVRVWSDRYFTLDMIL